MLRRILATIVLAVVAAPALRAQARPTAPADRDPAVDRARYGGAVHAEPKTGWQALDAFHETLAASWHPARRANDLAPARSRAGELAARADSLAGSSPPPVLTASCRAAATPAATRELAREVRAFAQLSAAQAPDARLKASLKRVHDRFELFEHRCAPGGEHH